MNPRLTRHCTRPEGQGNTTFGVAGRSSRQLFPEMHCAVLPEGILKVRGVPLLQHRSPGAAAALPVRRRGADQTRPPATTDALIMSRRETRLRIPFPTASIDSSMLFTSST